MPATTPPTGTYYTIYPERSDDLFDPEHDWREALDMESAGDIHITPDGGSTATMKGEIAFCKLRNFCLYAMGYAAADNAGPDWYMRRINPKTHPVFPFLRVRSISIRGLGPRKGTVATSPPSPPPPPPPASVPFPGDQDPTPRTSFEYNGTTYNHPSATLPARVASMRPRSTGEDFGGGAAVADDRLFVPFNEYTSRYEFARVQIDFDQPRYAILEDDDPSFDPTDESDRNVFWTTEPVLDVLALEGGGRSQVFWRETSSTGPNTATNIPQVNATAVVPSTSVFPSPLGFLDPKLTDTANWMRVPTRFIFDGDLIPTKILSLLGKTNATDWFGYTRGTALFMGASFEPVAWPIYSTDHHVVQMWNVKYHFKYYDPPRRDDADVTPTPDPSDPKRGFRCFRFGDGFAYHATRYNGDEFYGEGEFRNLFRHRQA